MTVDLAYPTMPDLPDTLPLFPLSGAVLLPRGRLPLNIFEPRYLAMTDYALGHGRMIGLIRPRGGDEYNPDLYEIGCAGRICSFSETSDGRYLITLTGVSRFRLRSEDVVDGGFRMADVDFSPYVADLVENAEEHPVMRERIIELLVDYLNEVGMKVDWESIEGASAETIVNSVSMSCPFDASELQALLEADTLVDRARTLIALMEFALAADPQDNGDERTGTLQ
ncbi:LON peptidase substrate-binding domain-containing protein [Parvularcula sp. LCG005]|uniref:LON peptidase substrate-binding domain-containing protein n=1 Tax=Parvularcula sp. LCG005 TaxID=3078805 RepID=UPI002941C0D9|nr:LON peptidase substrate-binding domain-containing protein [Parvularcula sp. LCG005]WOI53446.1 LON peptidase substrate-binding domain-containing protein [Parvularcula sp. LCG005]